MVHGDVCARIPGRQVTCVCVLLSYSVTVSELDTEYISLTLQAVHGCCGCLSNTDVGHRIALLSWSNH